MPLDEARVKTHEELSRSITPIAPKITLGAIHRTLQSLIEQGATVESIRWVADNQLTTEDEK